MAGESGNFRRMKHALLCLLLLLSACRDAQPPLPTSEQSDRLNEAEAMLNEAAQ